MAPAAFTLRLGDGDKHVSVEALAEVLENALTILHNLQHEITSKDTIVRWEVVGASLQSPLTLTIAPVIQSAIPKKKTVERKMVTAFVHGIGQLERGPTKPAHFNDAAMQAVQSLAKIGQKEGAKVTVAANSRNEISFTPHMAENIQQVVARVRTYIDYGTLEGRLEEISLHGRLHIAIWDDIVNQKIECDIADDYLEEAKTLLGQRVAVSGSIRYKNQKPTSIQVESVRRLRGMDELLRLKDIPPIDITGGLSSEEYVRRMRDAQ